MNPSLKDLLYDLIRFPSITPNDEGCQDYIANYLESIGFVVQRFNKPPVSNIYAQYGQGTPSLIFAGHTDVVPVGDRHKWHTDPFELHEENGLLYGRGTADMKGSLASMMLASQHFIKDYPNFKGSLGFLITSGEEGDDYALGTPYVMQQLKQQGICPQFCIVGEPSSHQRVGDVIKIGRRGSLNAKLTFHGKQGHVAYPHLADNPIHKLMPALSELTHHCFDEGNEYFAPTSLQITHLQAGGHGNNVIPGEVLVHFNVRYSTQQTATSIQSYIEALFKQHQLSPILEWTLSGEPFLTAQGKLLDSCVYAIETLTGNKPSLSTGGGTSDARFIAPHGVEVVELGPVNATIHQVNECVSLSDLEMLVKLYYTVCESLIYGNLPSK